MADAKVLTQDTLRVLGYALLSLISFLFFRVWRRIFFHNLSHVPGPKLAAATWLYQTYYSFKNDSQYYLQIEKLHKIYGPVIRITPDEVHLSDPDNYETIYHVGSKYGKYSRFYDAFSIEYSSFTTPDNDVHRRRRGALNPFFSRKMVLELESIVQSKVEKLCSLVKSQLAAGETANLFQMFRAVSVDVTSDYAFGKSYDLLSTPDLGATFFRLTRGLGPSIWMFQQFPFLLVSNKLPSWILEKMDDSVAQIVKLKELAGRQLKEVDTEMKSPSYSESKPARRTIFHELLTPRPEIDYVVPPISKLEDEAVSILAASSDTTGNGITVAAYNVVRDPEIYEKLKQELRTAFPDANQQMTLPVLEKLPYLTGIVKEGLRLSFGVITRLPRVVPPSGAIFNGVRLPAGTAVSMTSWMMHQDPIAFPDPFKFDPNRWIDDPSRISRMEKSFVPFGKGSRQCVGMPLAYSELYITLGTLFRRFENLKCNELNDFDKSYIDYLASHPPIGAETFKVFT